MIFGAKVFDPLWIRLIPPVQQSNMRSRHFASSLAKGTLGCRVFKDFLGRFCNTIYIKMHEKPLFCYAMRSLGLGRPGSESS